MALGNFKNFAAATVSTGYDASATSIVLTTGQGANLPAAPFYFTWYNSTDYANAGGPSADPNVEIGLCTSGPSGDTLTTILRGQQQTLGGLPASTKNTAGKTYTIIADLTAADLVSGIKQVTVVPRSADYSLTNADNTVPFDCSGGLRTATLPTAVGIAGQSFTISKSDSSANPVAITGTSGQLLGPYTTDWLFGQWASITYVSDGANWIVRGKYQPPIVKVNGSTDALDAGTTGTTETAFATTLVLPANFFTAGRRIRLTYDLEYTGTGTPPNVNHSLRTSVPTILYSHVTGTTLPTSVTRSSVMSLSLTGTAAPGSSVAVEVVTLLNPNAGPNFLQAAAAVAIPTNGALTLQYTQKFSAATASNIARLRCFTAEFLN